MLPFSRVWAALLLMLVAATFRLWFPANQAGEMPSIPLLKLVPSCPVVVLSAVSWVMLVALIAIVVAPLRCRSGWWWVLASLAVSFLLDQHRLQPWAYQSAIYAAVFAVLDDRHARRWLVPLAASVYLYSAVGKVDVQFLHTVGQEFLDALSRPFGGMPQQLSESTRAKLAMLFPTTEFFAGLGLLFPATRPIAGAAVMLMHATLIAILGPWGLDHSTGVLVWNAALLVQAYLLMVRPGWQVAATSDHSKTSPVAWFVVGLMGVAMIAPLGERSGYWDHWLSWSLYSPHTSRVEVEIHVSALQNLPAEVLPFVETDSDHDGWHKLTLEQWSLETRGVPVYPQARYQLALVVEFAQRHRLTDEIRGTVRGVSDRWTGKRTEMRLLGRRELESGLRTFWLTS